MHLVLQVRAIVDPTGTGSNVSVYTLLIEKEAPNGVAWHDGSLFVSETTKVTRYDKVDIYALTGQVSWILYNA